MVVVDAFRSVDGGNCGATGEKLICSGVFYRSVSGQQIRVRTTDQHVKESLDLKFYSSTHHPLIGNWCLCEKQQLSNQRI